MFLSSAQSLKIDVVNNKKKVRKIMDYFHLRYHTVVFMENFICSFESKILLKNDCIFGEIPSYSLDFWTGLMK